MTREQLSAGKFNYVILESSTGGKIARMDRPATYFDEWHNSEKNCDNNSDDLNEFYDSDGKVILLFFEGQYFYVVDVDELKRGNQIASSKLSSQNSNADPEGRSICHFRPPILPEQVRLAEDLETLAREIYSTPIQIADFCTLICIFKNMSDRKSQLLKDFNSQRPHVTNELHEILKEQHEIMSELSNDEKQLFPRMLKCFE